MHDLFHVIISVDIADEGWAALPDPEDAARCAVTATLTALGVDENSEIAVLFTGDGEITELNRDWRGKAGPTNVLSFPADDFPLPPGEPRPLGDMALSHATVAREAGEQGKTLRDHTIHLIVHATLHLLGHDHMEPGEAEAMEDLERRILSELGIADPYE